MPETFPSTIELSYETPPSSENKAIILRNKFGDGYTQRASVGINSINTTYTVHTGVISDELGLVLENFLEEMKGVESFYWTPRGYLTASLWTCEEWQRVGMTDLQHHCQFIMKFVKEYDLL